MQMCLPARSPGWVSRRRLLDQNLSDLHRCTNLAHIKQVHAQILKAHLHQDPHTAPKLIAAFSLCRHMALAVNVFNQVHHPNVHLYNTLIRAHIHNNQPSQAFAAFFDMQAHGVYPDNFTFPFLLKACSGKGYLHVVLMIHAQIEKFGFCGDIFVPNSLIDTYSKCGLEGVGAARKLFRVMEEKDIVSWNSMIGGLARAGELSDARQLFDEMPERDAVSWNSILDGYAKAGKMDEAFELFERMPQRNVVSWSTLVSGYSKVGDMGMARMMFDRMPFKNLVPWTIIISGYAQKGLAKEAIMLYDQMEGDGLKLDNGAIISILAACAESGLIALGKKVHESIERNRFKCSTPVLNALLDMYAKCGGLEEAYRVFDGIARKDLVSWNSMLQGLAMHGHGEKALQLFSRMEKAGFRPDKVTFIGVLCACTHSGFVEEGLDVFHRMEKEYGIVPEVEHYGCMIDLLGRGGRLREAFRLVYSMPMEPNAVIWGTLLGACRMHNDIELAEKALDQLVKLDPSDPGNFSIVSNMYAAAGDWENMANMRLQMRSIGVQKTSGASSIEVDDEVHEFTVFDRVHPYSSDIYGMINRLGEDLKQVDTSSTSISVLPLE
ncbi:PREDICTED: pentatricopeptide repeat-containing protein At3g29230 [Fragaria vesca subsp. vesca]|uniref:pentatricopeptide repeat-containing protein At3g29230 n=1 Tax=Fragaria vesca subsp. vesca TaxID=101020 RepID=UPI0002C2F180|nr:PREDICTED: pentatricopeptide repeat-containing protein At3g29230 [Fragaria vesca subsp. vesca]